MPATNTRKPASKSTAKRTASTTSRSTATRKPAAKKSAAARPAARTTANSPARSAPKAVASKAVVAAPVIPAQPVRTVETVPAQWQPTPQQPAAYAPQPVQPSAVPFGAPVRLCPNCKAQAQTAGPKCPHCNKKYAKKKHTVLKIFLGVFAALMAFIILIVVLIGAAANKAVNDLNAEQKAHAIPSTTFSSIKLGATKAAVLRAARPATLEDTQEFEDAGVLSATDIKSSCIYFNKQGGSFGDIYQFCFTGNKLTTKNSY
jgi:hypothetical protein